MGRSLHRRCYCICSSRGKNGFLSFTQSGAVAEFTSDLIASRKINFYQTHSPSIYYLIIQYYSYDFEKIVELIAKFLLQRIAPAVLAALSGIIALLLFINVLTFHTQAKYRYVVFQFLINCGSCNEINLFIA